jgi:hypothetical protein
VDPLIDNDVRTGAAVRTIRLNGYCATFGTGDAKSDKDTIPIFLPVIFVYGKIADP